MTLAIRLRGWWPVLPRLVPPGVADALRLGLTAVVAFGLAMELEFSTPEWAGWTVLAVSMSTRASSLQKSLWRAIGSLVGAAVAVAVVAAFAQDTLAFDLAIAGWSALAALLSSVERGQRSYGFALMGFTVPIIALSVVDQPMQVFPVAADRCSTILLGIACAHVSSVLVARGAGQVGRELSAVLERTAEACAAWIQRTEQPGEADPEPPPTAAVLQLDEAIFDGMVEQPSLRTGGRFLGRAAIRLLSRLAAGLAAPMTGGARRAGLLLALPGAENGEAFRRRRVAVVARLLRDGRRIGTFHAPVRALGVDRDWVQARNNAVRAVVAVGLVDAFSYCSEWQSGATAATWTAVVSTLLAARADAADAARDFMLGGLLACVVGIPLHYTALTVSGHFGLLAAVLFPLAVVAAVGRTEAGAPTAAGFAFLIFGVMSIHNRMTYDLASDLNGAVAELSGMGVAVAAFRALPPPAGEATRRRRAQRRMASAVRFVAGAPRALLPDVDRWLPPMFRRLSAVADVPDGPPDDRRAARALLLAGLLILALRREDDRLGRQAGRRFLRGGGEPDPVPDVLLADRLRLLERLGGEPGLKGWPGLRR